jgi:hypothetical protein
MNVDNLPTSVRDSELEVTVENTGNGPLRVHSRPLEFRKDSEFQIQRWKLEEVIGHGGYGSVLLMRKIDGPGIESMAHKQMELPHNLTLEFSNSRQYLRELKALAKFRQKRSVTRDHTFIRIAGFERSIPDISSTLAVGFVKKTGSAFVWTTTNTSVLKTLEKAWSTVGRAHAQHFFTDSSVSFHDAREPDCS